MSNTLVPLISTCIGTQVTETDALVVADISITQGGIDIRKLSAIDSACQLQSIMKKIHNFKNMCKKKKMRTRINRDDVHKIKTPTKKNRHTHTNIDIFLWQRVRSRYLNYLMQ